MSDFVIYYLPVLVLLGFFVFLVSRLRNSAKQNTRIVEMNEELLSTNREMAQSLRNIQKLLENRKP